jgi:hypothetical protein
MTHYVDDHKNQMEFNKFKLKLAIYIMRINGWEYISQLTQHAVDGMHL